MLARRLIPCLDVRDGRVVKGIRFQGLRDAGSPPDLAAEYERQGADEIALLGAGQRLELTRESQRFETVSSSRIDDDLCPVWIDPDRFSQCLLNLYLNAIQAMDKGGTLGVRCRSDRVRQLEIAVSDTGQGIAPADRQQIFNPYFTTKPKGTGLGLASVYGIVKSHEGYINAESKKGRGTTFLIYLPAADKRKEKK